MRDKIASLLPAPPALDSRGGLLRRPLRRPLILDLQLISAWLKRLAQLDIRVFDEVRTNPAATIPCALIAAVSILIGGIGGWLWWSIRGFPESGAILIHSTII